MAVEKPQQLPSPAERQERLELAISFLEMLLEQLSNEQRPTVDEVKQSFEAFCKGKARLATTFDIGHSYAITYERIMKSEEDQEGVVSDNSSESQYLVAAYNLLRLATFGDK